MFIQGSTLTERKMSYVLYVADLQIVNSFFIMLQIKYNLASECQSVCVSECPGALNTFSVLVTRADGSQVCAAALMQNKE